MKQALKYIIGISIGVIAALLLSLGRGLLDAATSTLVYHNLSDSFMVIGTVTTGFGLLMFLSNQGAFDGISYGLKSFFGMFRKNYVKESYYDYRLRRGEGKLRFTTVLVSGLVVLFFAVVFYLLYRNTL